VLTASSTPDTANAPASPGYLAQLNDQQRQAVEFGISGADAAETGPLLVLAGAGSGKTHTLGWRVAHLVANGADPQRILLLTFSRRAASELSNRAGHLLARAMQGERSNNALNSAGTSYKTTLPWAGTFHGIGARLLREYAERVGLAPDFTIHDRSDSADLLNVVRHELNLSTKERRFPLKQTCIAIYSRAINAESPLNAVLKHHFPWCAMWETQLRTLFDAYVEAKQAQHVLDYDDLLLYWHAMVSDAELAADIGARFDHILVDEYQDTNRLQSSILRALRPDGRGVTVVGDDAQSIYAFRAATVRNILDFPRHFSRPAHTVLLERNYRSTQPILDASNGVMRFATERFAKTLWTDRASTHRPRLISVRDEAEQARCVAEQVLHHREGGLTLKSQAVLFRTASHSAPLEIELTRRNIPFVKYGGLKFLEAAHVKDVLSVLRWAENPRNRIAGFRVIQLLPGAGPATAARVLDAMAEAADPIAALLAYEPPARLAGDWSALMALMQALRTPKDSLEWAGELGAVGAWYSPHMERLHDDAAVRQGDLDQLARMAATYATRERFLTEMTLDPPELTSDESGDPYRDEDYLILSTIHSSKGQEWKAVYVLNAVDGCMPADLGAGSHEELEEERRLLYVAMTRAREHLDILVPQRFYVTQQTPNGDRHIYASRTRFIPPALLPMFEACAWPEPEPGADPAAEARAAAKVDLSQKMRGYWKK